RDCDRKRRVSAPPITPRTTMPTTSSARVKPRRPVIAQGFLLNGLLPGLVRCSTSVSCLKIGLSGVTTIVTRLSLGERLSTVILRVYGRGGLVTVIVPAFALSESNGSAANWLSCCARTASRAPPPDSA